MFKLSLIQDIVNVSLVMFISSLCTLSKRIKYILFLKNPQRSAVNCDNGVQRVFDKNSNIMLFIVVHIFMQLYSTRVLLFNTVEIKRLEQYVLSS